MTKSEGEQSAYHGEHPQEGILVPGRSVSLRALAGRENDYSMYADTAEPVTVGGPYDKIYSNTAPSWQEYHNAWQRYYQQYYQRYYWHQLQLQQRALRAVEATTIQPEVAVQRNDTSPEASSTVVTQLRHALRRTIRERARRFWQSYHFIPLATAACVGLLFLFLQYNQLLFAQVNAYVSPGSSVNANDVVLVDPTANLNVGPEPRLIIPKIAVNAEVFYDITTTDTGPIEQALNNGVVHYNLPGANSLPGQVGNTVVLGHSSNDIFNPGNSKFVFVLLDRLQPGDVFYLNYQGTRYTYQVSAIKIIKPTDISALQINTAQPMATLVTCTPLGTDRNRLLVIGEQISPDPKLAAQPQKSIDTNKSTSIPGSSPSVIDRIMGAL